MKQTHLKCALANLAVLGSFGVVFADVIAPTRVFVTYLPYFIGFIVFIVVIMIIQHINNKRNQ